YSDSSNSVSLKREETVSDPCGTQQFEMVLSVFLPQPVVLCMIPFILQYCISLAADIGRAIESARRGFTDRGPVFHLLNIIVSGGKVALFVYLVVREVSTDLKMSIYGQSIDSVYALVVIMIVYLCVVLLVSYILLGKIMPGNSLLDISSNFELVVILLVGAHGMYYHAKPFCQEMIEQFI
ncbi:hypothetical protein PFISCL1PPCAC_24543, partial [Pristionchus fissidentatus]